MQVKERKEKDLVSCFGEIIGLEREEESVRGRRGKTRRRRSRREGIDSRARDLIVESDSKSGEEEGRRERKGSANERERETRATRQKDSQKVAGLNAIGFPAHSERVYRTWFTHPTRSLCFERGAEPSQSQRRELSHETRRHLDLN